MISAKMPYEKQYQDVQGKKIAYVEVGEGDPIVLLHGNPTSSYLWRNVIPELSGVGRIIAPDLIGQGDSEKLPASDGPQRYSFHTAYRYLDGLLQAIGADQNVTLVVHDWGGALGFYWAQQHPTAVRGIAYMESIVCPVPGMTGPREREVFSRDSGQGKEKTWYCNAICLLKRYCQAQSCAAWVKRKCSTTERHFPLRMIANRH